MREIFLFATISGEIIKFPRAVVAGGDEFGVANAEGSVVVVIEIKKIALSGAVFQKGRCETDADGWLGAGEV